MGYTETEVNAFKRVIKSICLYDTSYKGYTYFQDNLKYRTDVFDPLSYVAQLIDSCLDPYEDINDPDFDMGIESRMCGGGKSFNDEMLEVMKQLKDKFYFAESPVSSIMDCFYKSKATDFFKGFSMEEDIKNWDYCELINDYNKANDKFLGVQAKVISEIRALNGSDRKDADKLVDMYEYATECLAGINGEKELTDAMSIDFYRSCKPVLKQLKEAKTVANSDEYKNLITKFENLVSGDRLNVFGENSKEEIKKQLNEICDLAENYILHKAELGVKDNAIPKLDAVIDLYKYCSDNLSSLGAERNVKNIDSKELKGALVISGDKEMAPIRRSAVLGLFEKKFQLENTAERESFTDLMKEEGNKNDKKLGKQNSSEADKQKDRSK